MSFPDSTISSSSTTASLFPPPPASQQLALTRVDGIGQWNSWTRNFNTPLLALLDLLDNSFDAALEPKKSEISDIDGEPRPDVCLSSSKSYKGKIVIEADRFPTLLQDKTNKITGVCITNNSYYEIKTMGRILEAYSSAKGRMEHGDRVFAETIGENGVGLKQGCAVLSDLSFVLMKKGTRLSMGIVAARLQKREGICLPSFEFESEDGEKGLRSEMEDTFGIKFRDTVGECVAEYGDGSLAVGINRLITHFNVLTQSDAWGDDDYVFRVVLHNIKKDAKTGGDTDDELVESGEVAKATDTIEQDLAHSRAKELMDEVRRKLPRHYIHIPSHFEIIVDENPIDFCYWQRRLVELTEFNQYIDSVTPISAQQWDWVHPQGKGAYKLRIWCGFDPVRLQCDGQNACNLLIYSRHSGRLIVEEEDARALLHLGAGSSNFAQGLTIIVDDIHGHLPLNPTKQEIAWGEQTSGNVHKKNLYTWIGAIAYLYWSLHFKRGYGESKTKLTAAVKQHSYLPADASDDIKPLDQSHLAVYKNIKWRYAPSNGTVRCPNMTLIEVVPGKDTLWRLEYTRTESASNPKKKRKITEVAEVVELKAKYEETKEECEKTKEECQKQVQRYKEKKDRLKNVAEVKFAEMKAEIKILKRSLVIEKKMRLEDKEEKECMEREKDAIIERLRQRNKVLEERAALVKQEVDEVYSGGTCQVAVKQEEGELYSETEI